ncbi:MAG: hypothetical protein FWE57_01530 [Chitinispirillia bacterium]|nr:hypothetical protein [Chitinispirillia bacterium]
MKSKFSFLSLSFASLLLIVSLAVTADQTDDNVYGKDQAENLYHNAKLCETKKQNLENYRKQLVDEARRECCGLKKGRPLFLRAVHCPELVEKEK